MTPTVSLEEAELMPALTPRDRWERRNQDE